MTRMQRPEIAYKRDDRRPTLTDQLTDSDGDPIDLTTADGVKLFVEHDDTGRLIVNDTANIVDAANGLVEYSFEPGETAREGRHLAEWVIQYTDEDGSAPYSRPSDGFLAIDIHEPLDREADVADVSPSPDLSVTTLQVDQIQGNTVGTINVISDLNVDGVLSENDSRVATQADIAGVLTETDDASISGTWLFQSQTTFDASTSFNSTADFDNEATFNSKTVYDVDGNDVHHFSDGSDGSNSTAYTMRYDPPRAWRVWSGTASGAGTVIRADHDGDVFVPQGELSNRGDLVVRADGDRKIYVSNSEPSGWEDGDLWFEPQG